MEKELKQKLNSIVKSIGNIETDVSSLKTDMKKVKVDIGQLKIDTAVNRTNIVYGFSEAKKERAEIKEVVGQTRNLLDGFVKRIDDLDVEFDTNKEDTKRIKVVIKEKLGVDMA